MECFIIPHQFTGMKRLILLILLNITVSVHGQKLEALIGLNTPFSGISGSGSHDKKEFKPSVLRFNISWEVAVLYKRNKMAHVLTLAQLPLGKNFKVVNRFNIPPDDAVNLGFSYYIFGTDINNCLISYDQLRSEKKSRPFIFKTDIKLNYSYGVGIGFNRSKYYYANFYSSSNGGWSTPWTYYAVDATHYRDGLGLFACFRAGIDFFGRKRKVSFMTIKFFYLQGLRKMAHFNIHYRYGYWNDLSKRIDKPDQILFTRGTTLGFALALPIVILK